MTTSSTFIDLEGSHQSKQESELNLSEEDLKSKSDKKQSKFQARHSEMVQFRYCRKCDNLQPPRADHCSFCGKCVLRFDHHCPWFANCIAFHTQKHFMLFLFYTMLACMLNTSCYIYGWSLSCYGTMPKDLLPVLALLATTMNSMGGLALLILTCYLVYLTSKNYLSGDVFFGSKTKHENPFNKSLFENFQEVMGQNPWKWLVPEKEIDRKCNGIDY